MVDEAKVTEICRGMEIRGEVFPGYARFPLAEVIKSKTGCTFRFLRMHPVSLEVLRRPDSNRRPLGYEPNELPTAPLRDFFRGAKVRLMIGLCKQKAKYFFWWWHFMLIQGCKGRFFCFAFANLWHKCGEYLFSRGKSCTFAHLFKQCAFCYGCFADEERDCECCPATFRQGRG